MATPVVMVECNHLHLLSTRGDTMKDHLINGYYVSIPEKTLLSKQWRTFTPSTQAVYWTMLLKYKRTGKDANGRVKWKQEELAEAIGLTSRTVIKCLQVLKDKEWISVWKPGGRWLDGTEYRMNPLWADGAKTPKAS